MIRQAGFRAINASVSSIAFVVGRIEIVSFGYRLVISGVPSADMPAGGRPILRFAATAMEIL